MTATTPAQVHAHEAAFRATLSPPQLAEYERIATERAALTSEPEEPEPEAEPRYSVQASRFAASYDTLPLSCAMVKRFGLLPAALYAFFEKFSARGEKEFFGGAPLFEAFTGLDMRAYRHREALIAAGLMVESDPASYDRRKRIDLDMTAKHQIVLDHAEALAARCAEHRNWRGLVARFASVTEPEVVDNSPKSKGNPLGIACHMGDLSPESEGLPYDTPCHIHMTCDAISKEMGLQKGGLSKSLSHLAREPQAEGSEPSEERIDKEGHSEQGDNPTPEAVAAALRETMANNVSRESTGVRTYQTPDPIAQPEPRAPSPGPTPLSILENVGHRLAVLPGVLSSFVQREKLTKPEAEFVAGKLASKKPGAVHNINAYLQTVLADYRQRHASERTAAPPPPAIGPDGFTVLHCPALETIKANASIHASEEVQADAMAGIREALKRKRI